MATLAADDLSYYEGSRKFLWLAEMTGLTIDQVNYTVSQVVSLLMAIILRKCLHPNDVSATSRHIFATTVGIVLIYFCHGKHMIHVVASPVLCYISLMFLSPNISHKVVLVIAVGYLSYVHLMRQIYSYGSYVLDITGPMMLITQKLTSLAFSLHDGRHRQENALNPDQKQQAIKKMPSFLEFFSYTCHFQALMTGPLVFYTDYIEFIEGKNFSKTTHVCITGMNGVLEEKPLKHPSPNMAVLKKLFASLTFGILLLKVTPLFPIQRVAEEEFAQRVPFFRKILYVILASSVVRFKYYHAWILADAICNASGLGFNGYDNQGVARWDLMSNVEVFNVETSISWRDFLIGWNKGTMLWLRRIAYERAPYQRTLVTYILSALWHGFYPGYYVTFLTGAMLTLSSRAIRRSIRPYFKTNSSLSFLYDVITCLSTRVIVAYVATPFVLLELEPSLYFYRHLYYFIHVIGVLSIIVLPLVLPAKRHLRPESDRPVTLDKQPKLVFDISSSSSNSVGGSNPVLSEMPKDKVQ